MVATATEREKQKNKELEELKASTELLISGLIEEHKIRESENVNDFIKERSNLIKTQQRRESQLIAYYVEQREAIKEAHLQELEEYKTRIMELEVEYGVQDTPWSGESDENN